MLYEEFWGEAEQNSAVDLLLEQNASKFARELQFSYNPFANLMFAPHRYRIKTFCLNKEEGQEIEVLQQMTSIPENDAAVLKA
jgi:hypothetical protein